MEQVSWGVRAAGADGRGNARAGDGAARGVLKQGEEIGHVQFYGLETRADCLWKSKQLNLALLWICNACLSR